MTSPTQADWIEAPFGVANVGISKFLLNELLTVFGVNLKGGNAEAQTRRFLDNLAFLSEKFDAKRVKLVKERDTKAQAYYSWCQAQLQATRSIDEQKKLQKLEELGFTLTSKEYQKEKPKIRTKNLPQELLIPGPQLVVPGDKANMVLSALNSRYRSLYDSVKGTNLLEDSNSPAKCKEFVHQHLDTFISFSVWQGKPRVLSLSEISGFTFYISPPSSSSSSSSSSSPTSTLEFLALTDKGEFGRLSGAVSLLGYTVNPNNKDEILSFVLEHRGLKIELVVDSTRPLSPPSSTSNGSNGPSGNQLIPPSSSPTLPAALSKLKQRTPVISPYSALKFLPLVDIRLESVLTFIIDKEDSSLSSPAIKCRTDVNIAGLTNGSLSVDLGAERGVRRIESDSLFFDLRRGVWESLKRTALPLVRDVGDHLLFDARYLQYKGRPVSEKTYDMLMSSTLGMYYHVLPKQHNEREVALAVCELEEINKLLGLEPKTQKIGVMNEEAEANLRWKKVLAAGGDLIFFTNSGFLDYFGSILDLLTAEGAFDSYLHLAAATAKVEYERNHVLLSLAAGVPQIGAGMWAFLDDKRGHRMSKLSQLGAGNHTSWNPDPVFGTLHALYYHQASASLGSVHGEMLSGLTNPPSLASLVTRPEPSFLGGSTGSVEKVVLANLQEAIYGLLAYAYPWVVQGVGCTAVRTLQGQRVMEDRATARIKTAFLRNWLSHGVVTEARVKEVINQMAEKLADDSKKSNPNPELMKFVVNCVLDCIFNPKSFLHSYIEEYFYFWRTKVVAISKPPPPAPEFKPYQEVVVSPNPPGKL